MQGLRQEVRRVTEELAPQREEIQRMAEELRQNLQPTQDRIERMQAEMRQALEAWQAEHAATLETLKQEGRP